MMERAEIRNAEERGLKMEMTSAEVKARIQMDLEQGREKNKAMLQDAGLRFYKRIFEVRSSMETRPHSDG